MKENRNWKRDFERWEDNDYGRGEIRDRWREWNDGEKGVGWDDGR